MLFLKRYGWLFIIPILIFLIIFQQKDDQQTVVQESKSPESAANKENGDVEASTQKMIVDVKGEVVKPGIYELNAGLRVNDAIDLAGGMTEQADQTSVNLAQKIQDEMVILVTSLATESEAQSEESATETTGKVRINQATLEEMQALPGIGPSKAEAIIKHREENGLFKKAEDLLGVSGIGEKTLENMIDTIQVP
ncbi:helix-hairpin-helix domain-containing protein [Halobacillus shinanisalinarum]|uniref:Helix-hairpin-helix domain-containing protein n=1 Tax=Halobacillus shinanisalinarum TaxID=2932258 RepID=A0ABY4H0E6_9BACI|nr:helix-hairpin-helix domain-containing protein [Halobacillus shinanisalinarum]UOQ93799.1 helix-hairpin-helix domain-containing protein [Halobacillus shinanisalinarum]